MTRAAMRNRTMKAAVAAFAVLCGAGALAVLATASITGNGATLERTTEARPQTDSWSKPAADGLALPSPLGR